MGTGVRKVGEPVKRATVGVRKVSAARVRGLGDRLSAYPGFRFAPPCALCFRLLRRLIERFIPKLLFGCGLNRAVFSLSQR
jgi:hypothetical protein